MRKTRIPRTCEQCGKPFEVQLWRLRRNPNEGRFCSRDCFGASNRGKPPWNLGKQMDEAFRQRCSEHMRGRYKGIPLKPEHRAKISAFWTGKKRDQAFRDLASRATVRRHEAGVYRGEGTAPEEAVAAMLDRIGIAYERQRGIGGPYVVDFFIRPLNLVIEADGDYWHAHPDKYPAGSLNHWQRKKVQRDRNLEALLARRGWAILRFWECELKARPHECERRLSETISRLGKG